MRHLLLCSCLAVVASCAHATHDQLTTRAEFDLRCPRQQLKVFRIDQRTNGVQGCGRQATYVESCDGDRSGGMGSCTWVLNSPPQP